jgi:cob(I)alamin adenosyltransferase
MKIYTKKGDQGTTALIGGRRVPKNDLKIETYGTVDELNSWIGLLRDHEIKNVYVEQLLEIQDRLFTAGSLLAADEGHKMQLPNLSESDIDYLENAIDAMNENLPEMKSFVLPGGHFSVSHCHIARCVCRRAERLCVALNEIEQKYATILKYLNRLSDYLFVLARAVGRDFNASEHPWIPRT